MQTILFYSAALIYAACALMPTRQRGGISGVTLAAWLVHGAALGMDMGSAAGVRVGFAIMLSAAMWLSVAAYWVENRNFALDGLRRLVMPCAAVLAYSTLTIAAFHAVLMALQESRLHTRSAKAGWLGGALDQLPALLTMEKLLFRLIWIGFVLLSLTVLSGIVFSEQLFGKALRWDHKSVFAVISWVLFAALLVGRSWRGWRGKTALRFTLAGFATLALAYVGSRFVLEVVLHRGLA
jgi:ABC-type uncharacterized transport system permease subunit